MLKVSFKSVYGGCPAKRIEIFNDKATIVTLTGTIKAPDWWWKIPKDIYKWMMEHPSVEVSDNLLGNVTVKVIGKSVCSEEDIFSSKLGERIAEARAKIKLYRFMYNLSSKIIAYNKKVLYGNFEVATRITKYNEHPLQCLYIDAIKYNELLTAEKKHLNNLLAMS